mgnify:CR=1 FL=1
MFDIVQYDCPVVWLTERVDGSSILVVGANVSEIRSGYEKIYVVILGDEAAVSTSIKKLDSMSSVKRYEVIQRKRRYAKLSMLIDKTKTMEATVNHDAFPLATWVALDGSERWTLGFHTLRQLREFMSRVSEYDYIEEYRIVEIPEHFLALDYVRILSLFSEGMRRLTDRQVKLLSTAANLGYYDWPRRANVSRLARELGISRVAVAKMLRRAEKNLVCTFLRMIGNERERRG